MQVQMLETYKKKMITDFEPGELMYWQPPVSKTCGFTEGHLVRFVEFSRGIVHADIVETDPVRLGTRYRKGMRVTSRLKKFYLWGKKPGDRHARCHWFHSKDKFPGES